MRVNSSVCAFKLYSAGSGGKGQHLCVSLCVSVYVRACLCCCCCGERWRLGVCTYVCVCVCFYVYIPVLMAETDRTSTHMGWLRSVGCLEIYVSLQNIGLFRRALWH